MEQPPRDRTRWLTLAILALVLVYHEMRLIELEQTTIRSESSYGVAQ